MEESRSNSAKVAEFYDHVVPHKLRADVPFYVETAKTSGGPVLELGCGTGRILIPTLRAGIKVTGLDDSPAMLEICRRRIEKETEDVRSLVDVIPGSMQDFGLDRKYHLVMIPFRGFQHLLNLADQMSCLRYVHAHLIDGGSLVLDLYNPWVHRLAEDNLGKEVGEEPEFTVPDGRRVVRRHRTMARDFFDQTNDEELIYQVTDPDGTQEQIVHSFRMRYLYRFEAEHLLARCGFDVEHVYADFDKTPYGSKYPGELIMVARKV